MDHSILVLEKACLCHLRRVGYGQGGIHCALKDSRKNIPKGHAATPPIAAVPATGTEISSLATSQVRDLDTL